MGAAGTVAGRAGAVLRSGPLSRRGFRLLAIGQLTSTAGDYCYAVALPWLVLTAHGRQSGPALLGVVLACYGVPRTALIPVGGMLADRIGPRRLMLGADVGRCVLVVALAVFASQRMSSVALLGPFAALIGAGEGLFVPASFSIVPSLVSPAELQAGNALSGAMVQAGSLAGPVLGGILVATGGSAPAFAADAATFALSALTLALIPARRERVAADAGAAPGPGEGAAPADGAVPADGAACGGRSGAGVPTVWQLVRASRLLQVVIVVSVAANLASGGTFDVALPALAHARFGASGYGALLACLGAGALAGTLVAARAGRLARPALAGMCAFGAMTVAIALVPFLGGLPGAAAAVFVLGITNGFGNVVFVTLLQRWSPAPLLGRVMSLVMLASLGSFPLSVAVSGLLVRQIGPSPFFPIAAGLVAVAVAGALSQREIRTFGADEARRPAPVAVEVLER